MDYSVIKTGLVIPGHGILPLMRELVTPVVFLIIQTQKQLLEMLTGSQEVGDVSNLCLANQSDKE